MAPPTRSQARPRASRSTLRAALRAQAPSLDIERELWGLGHTHVVGMDEVGRGAWAGPLTIGAVIAPQNKRIYKLRDSKQLTEIERESMLDRICDWAEAWAVGHASPTECDALGMSAAQRLAAQRALSGLGLDVDAVILDGKWDFVGHPVTRMRVRADAHCVSVAAASILAKVTRDRLMRADAEHYPAFYFDSNKGYPCPKHRIALMGYGPSAVHRRSWAFMDGQIWGGPRPRGAATEQPSLFSLLAPEPLSPKPPAVIGETE